MTDINSREERRLPCEKCYEKFTSWPRRQIAASGSWAALPQATSMFYIGSILEAGPYASKQSWIF